MNKYFGPIHLKKGSEVLVSTPVGVPCLLCQEPIGEEDYGFLTLTLNGSAPVHYECQMRSVIGSVGHQLKRCSCYGGTEEDPPGMNKREAAKAAVKLWERRQRADWLTQGQS